MISLKGRWHWMVSLAGENSLPRITASQQMIDGVFKLQPQGARHGPGLNARRQNVKCLDATPPLPPVTLS
jgi:hypothetical protein